MFLGKHQKGLIIYLLKQKNHTGNCGSDMRDVLERLEKRGLIQYKKIMKLYRCIEYIQYEVTLTIPDIHYITSEEANNMNSFQRYKELRDEPYREGFFFIANPTSSFKYDYYSRQHEEFGPFPSIEEAAMFYAINRKF
jgi:hypothetical protein